MRPNVILIMSDQHRADAMGCSGDPIVQTPSLDALAAGGARFSNAYVQCPVCMASRAAIHTGRYPRSLRIPSMGILPPEETTLAETLKRAGYATGMFGKLHFTPQTYTAHTLGSDVPLYVDHFLGPAGIDTPYRRATVEDPAKRDYGFDETVGVEDMLWGNWYEWLAEVSPEHVKYAAAENWGRGVKRVKYGTSPPARRLFSEHVSDLIDSRIPDELSASRFVTDRSIDFIRRNADNPFFVHLSYVDPHHPFNAPSDSAAKYDPREMPIPPPEDPSTYPSSMRGTAEQQRARMHQFPDELWQSVRANYYGMISNIDDCIGKLLRTLEELGIRENTIIIFTADHGEYAGGHRLLYKSSLLFDDIMRVPFIVNWPGTEARPGNVRAGAVIDDLVQEVDIYPTIMTLLGMPIHAGVQGHDLTPLMLDARNAQVDATPRAGGPPWGDPPKSGLAGATRPVHSAHPAYDWVFCEADDLPSSGYVAGSAIRTSDWKLNYFPHSHSGMMFNLAEDPEERRNLWDDPGYTARRNELTALLLDTYDLIKDPLPHRLTQA